MQRPNRRPLQPFQCAEAGLEAAQPQELVQDLDGLRDEIRDRAGRGTRPGSAVQVEAPLPERQHGGADQRPARRAWSAVRRSWLAALDEFLAQRMPDMGEQLGIARRLAQGHRVARARQVDVEDLLDPAGPGRQQDDAVGERQRLAQIVGHEQHGLLLALPDIQQHLVHVELGVGVERAERLVHQQDLGLARSACASAPRAGACRPTATEG